MSINIHKFLKQFEKEYSFMYDHRDAVAGYREAVAAFDESMAVSWFRSFVAEFIRFRGDIISSDREAAAFMFALEVLSA